MKKSINTQTLAEMVQVIETRDTVREFFHDNFYQTGLMSRNEWQKFNFELLATEGYVVDKYADVLDYCIEKAICPRCKGSLSVIVDNVGADENPYNEFSIKCNSCGWKE